MMARHASFSLLASVLALGITACGGEPEPKAPETPATPPPVENPAPPANPEPAASAAPAPTAEPTPPPAPPLTDEQIVAITWAANAGEVDQAKVAQKQGKDAKVKKFAATMIAHHGEANTKQKKLTDKAKITPADSDMSKQLAGDSQKLIDSWKDLKGPDFDKAYMDAQVKEHQAVLDALDQKALPAVKNADLKTLLTEVRGKVEAHLKEAKDIQAALAAAPAPAAGGDKKPAGDKPGATPATPATPPKK